MSDLRIYKFGSINEGDASMKNVLGGKGAGLAEMSSLGLPVPPGFIIPCEASVQYATSDDSFELLESIEGLVKKGLRYLTPKTASVQPLLSVRSGARVSMPGMMDTILNVGLTSNTLPIWQEKIGVVAALDSYRRLIQMYSSVALGIDIKLFEEALSAMKQDAGVKLDNELNADQLSRLVKRYHQIVKAKAFSFPDTLEEQLIGSITAVFRSWNNQRAVEYRKINNIPEDWGTAVVVQTMVFGNMNDKSATGVLFSRNPSTGEKKITGEYLVNAQGEDVVAGIRTPEPFGTLSDWNSAVNLELTLIVMKLEEHYKDMQDIEFTVESGKLYLLQTRNAKRSPLAAFQVAYGLASEGVISKQEAASRVTPAQLFSVMQDSIDQSFKVKPDFKGIAAGGGIVSGVAMLSSASAINCKSPCILVTKETDPDDIAGMNASVGILTATGGLTSHAAVVARGMSKSCVVGATDMTVHSGSITLPSGYIYEGDKITIDGATGNVWVKTDVPLIAGGASDVVRTVISWGQTLDKADRLELSPALSPDELFQAIANSKAGSIYIDTMLLEGRDRFVSGTKLTNRLNEVGLALQTSNASEVVVDLTGREGHYSPGDKAFDTLFGIGPIQNKLITAQKVQAVKQWSKDVRAKVLIKVGAQDSSFNAELVNAGFKVSGNVLTFADLLYATGPMSISPEVISTVFGSQEAYEVATKALEKFSGKAASKPLPVPGYWYEALTTKGI